MENVEITKRIAALEDEVTRLKTRIERMNTGKPWWERIAGTFQDDPVCEEAMELGRQYRRSLRPGTPRRPPRGKKQNP
jgi:hypothetical protein